MKLALKIAVSTLLISAPTLAAAPIYSSKPTSGGGDPNAISCYVGDATSRIQHAQCRNNAEWARIQAAQPDKRASYYAPFASSAPSPRP